MNQEKIEKDLVESLKESNKYKKILKRIVTLIITVIIIFVLYKIVLLKLYEVSTDLIKNSYPNNKNIKDIVIENDVSANTELEIMSYKIPDSFELMTDKSESNLVYDTCDTYEYNHQSISKRDASLVICGYRNTIYEYVQDFCGLEGYFIDIYTLMKKYNLNDEIDLIKYYKNNYKFKGNIFTSSSDIKINYLAGMYSTSIPSYNEFYFFDGSVKGYYIKYTSTSDIYFGNIVYKDNNDNYLYSFTFINYNSNKVTNETINEFLRSINFS